MIQNINRLHKLFLHYLLYAVFICSFFFRCLFLHDLKCLNVNIT